MSNLNERAARRRFEARELLDRLKNRPCKDCKKKFHPCQMDFVRMNDDRGLQISRMLLKSQATIVLEAAKCVLVCANCGRMRVYVAQRKARSGPT